MFLYTAHIQTRHLGPGKRDVIVIVVIMPSSQVIAGIVILLVSKMCVSYVSVTNVEFEWIHE